MRKIRTSGNEEHGNPFQEKSLTVFGMFLHHYLLLLQKDKNGMYIHARLNGVKRFVAGLPIRNRLDELR